MDVLATNLFKKKTKELMVDGLRAVFEGFYETGSNINDMATLHPEFEKFKTKIALDYPEDRKDLPAIIPSIRFTKVEPFGMYPKTSIDGSVLDGTATEEGRLAGLIWRFYGKANFWHGALSSPVRDFLTDTLFSIFALHEISGGDLGKFFTTIYDEAESDPNYNLVFHNDTITTLGDSVGAMAWQDTGDKPMVYTDVLSVDFMGEIEIHKTTSLLGIIEQYLIEFDVEPGVGDYLSEDEEGDATGGSEVIQYPVS